MIKFLVHRPVAVCMVFLAFVILGAVTYFHVPVSLLPDIAIPEITVQVSGGKLSARELENTVASPLRQQLFQITGLRDIKSESRDGNVFINLKFKYGVNTDLVFIEVNEKIDLAMNALPKETERPRVIKANATDIPVFLLHLTLKNQKIEDGPVDDEFLELSELVQYAIKRRIEQLPQVALVDITGTVEKQVQIIPKKNIMEILDFSLSDISTVLVKNNLELGTTVVKDGHYEYNINFSSIIRTLDDVKNIYLDKSGKIFKLKDIADIKVIKKNEEGISLYNSKRAITLGIIKQPDVNMEDLEIILDHTVSELSNQYQQITFSKSQNQTELLEYTISNLKQNLVLAFFFVCLVSFFFMNDARSPLIIGLSMVVSLIISLLFFYIFKISLNIVSLTGLVLALGMMIDNSIIVTDNINQYRLQGDAVDTACVKGTNEVIFPMLSSSFTTISVFLPLVFMSGIGGAIFFDQAFSVTVGLLVSFFTGIILLPVWYRLIYTFKFKFLNKKLIANNLHSKAKSTQKQSIVEKAYYSVSEWIFRHKRTTLIFVILTFPACVFLFLTIRKEKMPDITQNEVIVKVEWNENIHLQENENRSIHFLEQIRDLIQESSAFIGPQGFVINKGYSRTSSEAEFYLKASTAEKLVKLKELVQSHLQARYPAAIVALTPAGTIFERIFETGQTELTVEYYSKTSNKETSIDTINSFKELLGSATGYIPKTIPFQKQLNLYLDNERMSLYKISYDDVYQPLRASLNQEYVTTLRSYQQYLPIIIGEADKNIEKVIQQTIIKTGGKGTDTRKVPLSSFIYMRPHHDVKTIVAGYNGEYIPFDFSELKDPEITIQNVKKSILSNNQRDISFTGSYFSNKEMIRELSIILMISLLLMYFILAAQFESLIQPFIVLLEIPIAIAAALFLLMIFGYTMNLMSAIGIIVTCGIIINDSILKLDIINQLRKQGYDIMFAIHEAGRRRLNSILMTSLTSIVCMLPLLFSHDMGSEMEKPLALATIGGMIIGTPISLFVVPLVYWYVYKKTVTRTK